MKFLQYCEQTCSLLLHDGICRPLFSLIYAEVTDEISFPACFGFAQWVQATWLQLERGCFFFSLNNARLASDTGKNKELLFYQHCLCRIWPFCNFKQISKYQLCFSWVPLFVQLGSFWIKFHFSSFWIKEWSKEQSIPISFVKRSLVFFFLTPQSPEILGWGERG